MSHIGFTELNNGFESESFEIEFFGENISESFGVSSHGENHKRVSREKQLTG